MSRRNRTASRRRHRERAPPPRAGRQGTRTERRRNGRSRTCSGACRRADDPDAALRIACPVPPERRRPACRFRPDGPGAMIRCRVLGPVARSGAKTGTCSTAACATSRSAASVLKVTPFEPLSRTSPASGMRGRRPRSARRRRLAPQATAGWRLRRRPGPRRPERLERLRTRCGPAETRSRPSLLRGP